ncbi:MAG: C-terminal target protein [Ferruginibacter sp.]|nr:C-terminal target protein [Ferruginibacter sp.]
MKKTLLSAFLLFSLKSFSQALVTQVSPFTLNMGGGSAEINPTFFLDWSIGESTVIETFQGENPFSNSIMGIHWNVTSGILQPFDKDHLVYNFSIPAWTSQEVRLYPVPSPNIVFIEFRSAYTGKMTIQFYTQSGTLIGTREFKQINGNSIQSWDLSNQPSGAFYFKILLSSDNGVILKQGTFQVEKNK